MNKLIRDKIPNLLDAQNKAYTIRTLDDTQYNEALNAKLVEELNEVISAQTNIEKEEELADLFEVIEAFIEVHNLSFPKIIEVKECKKANRGAFEKRIFLENIE